MVQVVVDQLDGYRAFADGRRHPLHRPRSNVAGGEHARDAGLQQHGPTFDRPRRRRLPVSEYVRARKDVSPSVALDRWWQPIGTWLSTDQDDEGGSRFPNPLARGPFESSRSKSPRSSGLSSTPRMIVADRRSTEVTTDPYITVARRPSLASWWRSREGRARRRRCAVWSSHEGDATGSVRPVVARDRSIAPMYTFS
jgi:hypothetical protein